MRIGILSIVAVIMGLLAGKSQAEDTGRADDPGLLARVAVKAQREFAGPRGGTSVIGISTDGKMVGTSGVDRKVHLFGVEGGKESRVLEGTGKPIVSIVFSPDGKYVLAQDWEKTVTQWESATGNQVRTYDTQAGKAPIVFIDGDQFLLPSGNEVGVWKLSGAEAARKIEMPSEVASVGLSTDGKVLVTGHADDKVRTWDFATRKMLAEKQMGPDETREDLSDQTIAFIKRVRYVGFLRDGRVMALSGKGTYLWDWRAAKPETATRWLQAWTLAVSDQAAIAFCGTVTVEAVDLLGMEHWPRNDGPWGMQLEGAAPLEKRGGAVAVAGDFVATGTGALLASTGRIVPEGESLVRVYRVTQFSDAMLARYEIEKRKQIESGAPFRSTDPALVAKSKIMLQKELKVPTDDMTTLAVTTDGKTAATGSADGSVHLIDLSAGTEIRVLREHKAAIAGTAFSPDGKCLVTTAGSQVISWDVASGRIIRQSTAEGAVACVACVSNDELLLPTGNELRLVSLRTGEIQRRIPTPAEVTCLAVSADGKRVVTGHRDVMIRAWDFQTGKLLGEARLGPLMTNGASRDDFNAVKSVAWLDDARLVAGSMHGLFVWEPADKATAPSKISPLQPRHVVAAGKLNLAVMGSSSADAADLTGIGPGAPQVRTERLSVSRQSLAVGAIALGGDAIVIAANPAKDRSGKPADPAAKPSLQVYSAEQVSAAMAAKAEIRKYQAEERAIAAQQPKRPVPPPPLAAETAAKDAKAAAEIPIGQMKSHTDGVRRMAFSPDGKWMASASADKTVGIWEMDTFKLVRKLEGHADVVEVVAFSADGKRLLSTGWDNSMIIWETSKWEIEQKFKCGTRVRWAAFLPDGNRVVTAGGTKVEFWNVARDERIGLGQTGGDVWGLGVSDTGRVITGDFGAALTSWDPDTGKVLVKKTHPTRTGYAMSVDFATDDTVWFTDMVGMWEWNVKTDTFKPMVHPYCFGLAIFSHDHTMLESFETSAAQRGHTVGIVGLDERVTLGGFKGETISIGDPKGRYLLAAVGGQEVPNAAGTSIEYRSSGAGDISVYDLRKIRAAVEAASKARQELVAAGREKERQAQTPDRQMWWH